MAENSPIEWTDHTFNSWWGCTKVSPGCDHCYAERDAKRYQPNVILWGDGSTRRTFGAKHWDEPRKWNRVAAAAGKRARVFCASMADVFDKDGPVDERARLFSLIEATPFLDWQLLTKRIGNVARMIPRHWHDTWPANAWLGISVVNQDEADRDVPKLIAFEGPRVCFLSCEPLLGPIDLRRAHMTPDPRRRVDWVIVGGESGPHARPMHPQWARDIRDQCERAGVPFLFKQWGEWREARKGDRFDTSYGGGDRPSGLSPAFIIDRATGSVHCFMPDDCADPAVVVRVGKKVAGRELDGRTWDGMPS